MEITSSSVYKFSDETNAKLRKFRLSTSRKNEPQAIILSIDRQTFEVIAEDEVYNSLSDVADELPDGAPRYVLLSYPVKRHDGSLSSPYVMLFWSPEGTSPALKMQYAGATQHVAKATGVIKTFDVSDEDEVLEVADKLAA
ncbi:hypothetical protein FPQ18DRAFT_408150 [Pyronema domesticum]|nr:hypothetical protein FPQ18DRAFT_408150 [Pyronema domesticum]